MISIISNIRLISGEQGFNKTFTTDDEYFRHNRENLNDII